MSGKCKVAMVKISIVWLCFAFHNHFKLLLRLLIHSLINIIIAIITTAIKARIPAIALI